MAYNRCMGLDTAPITVLIKLEGSIGSSTIKMIEFDYHMNNDLGRMVLNPDVVVRSRGVMEKCSMCIQMTQKTILDAKLEAEQSRMESSKLLAQMLVAVELSFLETSMTSTVK